MLRKTFELFYIFFKIGAFTIGGGFAMLPLIQSELVDKKHWIDEDEFLDIISMAQSSPGPIAVNTAVFVGIKTGGFWGLIATVTGTILPSFIIILLIAVYFRDFRDNKYAEAFFKGIKPAVAALIAAPVYNMLKKDKSGKTGWAIAAVVMLILFFFKISPIWIIITAALGGLLIK